MDTKQDSSDIAFIDAEDVRTVLDWQQSRFHHIQSLSQGFIGGLIALLALVTTILVGFTDRSLNLYSTSFNEVSASYPFGDLTLVMLLIFNLFILTILSGLAMVSLFSAFSKLLGVLTNSGMENGIISNESRCLILPKMNGDSLLNRTNAVTRYQQAIYTNQSRIEATYQNFVSGSLRAVFFSMLLFTCFIYYYYLFDLSLYRILSFNILFGTFPMYPELIWSTLIHSDEDNDQNENLGTFAEKIFLSKGDLEDHLNLHPAEDRAFKIVYLLSWFAGLSVIIGTGYNMI